MYMKRLHQEIVRVVLLDGQLRCVTKLDIGGTVNESRRGSIRQAVYTMPASAVFIRPGQDVRAVTSSRFQIERFQRANGCLQQFEPRIPFVICFHDRPGSVFGSSQLKQVLRRFIVLIPFSTRSTSSRPYQERSKIAIWPYGGNLVQNRQK